jgi:hypothetical protein
VKIVSIVGQVATGRDLIPVERQRIMGSLHQFMVGGIMADAGKADAGKSVIRESTTSIIVGVITSAVWTLITFICQRFPHTFRVSHIRWLPAGSDWQNGLMKFLLLQNFLVITGILLAVLFMLIFPLIMKLTGELDSEEGLWIFPIAALFAGVVSGVYLLTIIFIFGTAFNLFAAKPLLVPLPFWYQAVLGLATLVVFFYRQSHKRLHIMQVKAS